MWSTGKKSNPALIRSSCQPAAASGQLRANQAEGWPLMLTADMQNYDLIVIGSGPAGQRAAIQGAKCGRKVAVVEAREIVGGACINTGTIPSKTMREAVMHLSGFQFQGIYGSNYHVKEKILMADLGFRVNQVIKTEVDVTQAQLTRNGVDVITG